MNTQNNNKSKYLIKVLLIALYSLFHIYILRDVRNYIFEYQVSEKFIQNISDSDELSFQKLDTRLFYINYSSSDTQITWRYKVPFGSYFFLGIIGLILIGASFKYFYVFFSSHGGLLILSILLLKLNLETHLWPLVVIDFSSHYLIPLISIGIIPIAFSKMRLRQTLAFFED
jgi:hypothetical protein